MERYWKRYFTFVHVIVVVVDGAVSEYVYVLFDEVLPTVGVNTVPSDVVALIGVVGIPESESVQINVISALSPFFMYVLFHVPQLQFGAVLSIFIGVEVEF